MLTNTVGLVVLPFSGDAHEAKMIRPIQQALKL